MKKGTKVKLGYMKICCGSKTNGLPQEKLKYIRGKIKSRSTSAVQVQDADGVWVELKNKRDIEEVSMMGMKEKYTASFNTPFMTPPVKLDFGYLSQWIQAE